MSDFDSIIGSQDTPIPGNDDRPQQQSKPGRQPPPEPVEDPELGDQDPNTEPIEEAPDDLLEDDGPAAPEAIAQAAQKWEDLASNPELPAELGDKLWTVKNGDREWQVPIAEMAKGYMRLNESTRRSQALDQREQQVMQGEQRFTRFFESIKQPEAFLEVFERQLGPEVIDQAFAIRQQRAEQDSSLIEAAGYAIMRRFNVSAQDPRVREAMIQAKGRIDRERKLDIQQRKLEARNRELESRTQEVDTGRQVEELRAKFQHQFDQLAPLAFKAARIRDNPVNRDKLVENLKRLAKQQGAKGITRDLVQEAARCLREDLEDERAAKTKQPTAAAPKTTGRVGAGTGAAATRGHVASGSKSMRDFDAHFGRE